MSLRELFPAYPLILKTPPKSLVKFGTRSLYVDLPWQAYYFLAAAMSKGAKAGLTAKEVKEEWRKFLEANKEVLTFRDKPFVMASLRFNKFLGKSYLRLDVKWDLFVEYLEEKARTFLSEVREIGENIMKVYGEIWINFFGINGVIAPPMSQYFPSSRERFRKLLKRTGDYFYIEKLLDRFENMMRRVEISIGNKIPSVRLYTINLIMDIQHLRALVDIANIPAAYLLLRNLLENLVKLFIYLDFGKSIDTNLILALMFIYEYEMAERRRRVYSLKKFKEETIKKLSKIIISSPEEISDLSELINRLKEKRVPTIGINPQVLNEFSERFNLNEAKLAQLYKACSAVIHNQPPLPFFSLFEVKFFKHFLESYVQSLRVMVEKLTNEKISVERIQAIQSIPKVEEIVKNCLQAAYVLIAKHGIKVEEIVKKALITLQKKERDWIWTDLLTLASIFHLLSPSLTHLRKLSFVEEDMRDVIEKLQPISFRISIQDEIQRTLTNLQDIMLPDLERYEVFSTLKSTEEKRKTIFYLLLHYLPRMIKEDMTKSDKKANKFLPRCKNGTVKELKS